MKVDEAVQEYFNTPPQPLESMFDYLYAKLPDAYLEQRDLLKNMENRSHG